MSSDFFKKGKLLLVFLFFIFCPFLFQEELIDPSNSLRAMALPLLLLVYLLVNRHYKTWIVPPFYFQTFFFCYLLIVLSGLFFALNTAEVLASFNKAFLFYSLLCVALQWWDNQPVILSEVIRSFSLVFSLCLFIIILQLPDLSRKSLYTMTLFYEHKNLLASFVFILLGFSVLQLQTTTLSHRWLTWVTTALLVILLLVLQVRSVYLAVFGGLAVLLYFHLGRQKVSVYGLPVLVILTAAIFLKGPDRFFSLLKPYLGSVEERLQFWKKTSSVILDHPLLGCGSGNWQFNFTKTGIEGITNLENGITAQHPHNEVLAIWSENGLAGLLALILIVGFLLRHTRYVLRKERDKRTELFLAILFGVFIDAFFSFPKERYSSLAGFAFLLGAFMGHLQLRNQITIGITTRRLITALLLLILGVSFFRSRGEYYTKVLLAAQQRGDAKEMIRAGKKAWSPFYTTDPTSSPIAGYLGAAYFTLGKNDSLLLYSRKAAELAPYDYEVQSNLGFALTRAGKPQEARKHLQEALRIHPHYEGAWLNLVVLDYSLKNYEDALNELMEIPDFQRKYPEHLATLQKAFAESLQSK
jgi:O-antigen ligase